MENIPILNVNNEEFLPKVIELVNQGKHVRIPLKGFSVNPWLVGGRDYAELVALTGYECRNDVVLVELSPGHFALHRINKMLPGKVQTIGDGNLSPDPWIPLDQMKARVIGFYRKGRHELQLANSSEFKRYTYYWNRLKPVRRWLLALYRRTVLPKQYRNYK